MKSEHSKHKAGLELGLAVLSLAHPEAALVMPLYNYIAHLFENKIDVDKKYAKEIISCIKKAMLKTKEEMTTHTTKELIYHAEQYMSLLSKRSMDAWDSVDGMKQYLDELLDYITERTGVYAAPSDILLLSDTFTHHFQQEIANTDETFFNDYKGYDNFINDIKNINNCRFWIGCREDFFKSHYSEKTSIFDKTYRIKPWEGHQADHFITEYGNLINDSSISNRIINIVSRKDLLEQIKHNPFQLSILAYIAEMNVEKSIDNIFDLYENFMAKWIDNEIKRGTCLLRPEVIIMELRNAAKAIYQKGSWELTEMAEKNSAIKNILTEFSEPNMYGKIYVHAFYHRSIAAFILAESVVSAMSNKDFSDLTRLFSISFKDDVTNFIIDKLNTLTLQEKNDIKTTMVILYDRISGGSTKVQEQCIYYATRLGIDVSDFLCRIIDSKPNDPHIRLSLAYGCVLSDNINVRSFALEYAKSIASGGIDAVTNRAWTVIYFGDIVRDPYTYKDDEQCPWQNARNARLTRFTKKNPRKKDYRFRLFDIPLFLSYLENRNWMDISAEELEILESVDFPNEYFTTEEIDFLCKQKEVLVTNYRLALALEGGNLEHIKEVLWNTLAAFEGYPFKTAKGLQYYYTIKGNEIFFSRKEKSVTRASVDIALETAMELKKNGIPITGPKMIKCFGASYVYPVFHKIGVI